MIDGLSATAVSLASPPDVETIRPNIIYIMVDSLRADHVSAYGYERETTPNLDAVVADQGVVFTEATVVAPWTYPSNAAMLTSRMPSDIGVDWPDNDTRIPESEMMLAEFLQEAGYYTAGFTGPFYAEGRFGFDQGFDVYMKPAGENRANDINDLAMGWLSATWTAGLSGTQPLFLYLYYYDPHSWYDPPPPYDTMYDSTYTGTLTAEVYGHGKIVVTGQYTPTQRDIEHLLALYDGEITYWDFRLGEMFDYLDSIDLLEESIILVTSDHGQMFGEHGKWLHRNSLYEEVLRVPFLLRYRDLITPGQVITTPVQTLDVTPTLLDLAGLPVPDTMQGMSLLPLAQGAVMTESRPIYSEIEKITDPEHIVYWIAPHTEMYSVKQDGWKYIHTLGLGERDELFQVEPLSIYERENQIDNEPALAEALYQELVGRFSLPTEFLYLPVVETTD